MYLYFSIFKTYILLCPNKGAEYCDDRICVSVCICVCVCLCVCLSASISLEIHFRASPDFLCVLHTVARSSSGGFAICYVLPVLWMTLYLPISQGSSTWPPSSWKRRNTRCMPLTGLHFGRRGLGLPVVVLHIYDVMFAHNIPAVGWSRV